MIEQALQQLTEALNRNTEALLAARGAAQTGAPTLSAAAAAAAATIPAPAAPAPAAPAPAAAPAAAPAPAPAAAPAAAPAPAPAPAPAVTIPTSEEANARLLAVFSRLTAGGNTQEQALQKLHGAIGGPRITDMPQDTWSSILARAEALGV